MELHNVKLGVSFKQFLRKKMDKRLSCFRRKRSRIECDEKKKGAGTEILTSSGKFGGALLTESASNGFSNSQLVVSFSWSLSGSYGFC